MENLVQEIASIEKQADRIVEEAREKAIRLEDETSARIRALEEQLAQSVQKEIEAHRAAKTAEREAEEARLRQSFDKDRAAVASVSEETIRALAGKVVQRIKGA